MGSRQSRTRLKRLAAAAAVENEASWRRKLKAGLAWERGEEGLH